MIRVFQFVTLLLGLSIVALACAIVTMRFAIHGAEVTTPNFKGMTTQEALNKAADLGVVMTVDNRLYSAEVPAGRILTQSPVPGTVVRREWHLRAAESLGPQTVAIPNLVGQPQRTATIEIRRLGLEPGSVAHMQYAGMAPGTIIAQDPPAGAAGVEKPSVNIVVSDAAPEQLASFVMPDFVGQQYATAAATISRAGLKLTSAQQLPIPEAAQYPTSGTVTGQKPEAGYQVQPDTPIELTVVR
jgi:beta-lactam-binding protein with PASTA domain